ncbi:MAG: phosphopantetheine-binding protein, partial [Bacteroidota bacterium]
SMHLCAPNNSQDPPIGVPITNVRLYVVDELCQPVPVGVAGELLIGGVGLARGYLGRPDLTAERFIPSPFGPQQGERLYRSGDLCRHLSDGAIEYLGRIDQQVKVRGFRVEPGEIEAVLDSHPEVSEAVVIVREDTPGDRRIVAYVVADRERSLTAGNLRHYLGSRLPDYMIPYAFVFLESFPLTPSGKVDRRALPVPDPARRDVESSYVPPRTPVETALAEHCAQLLGLEKVGIRDSFFELGGHSLLATQLMSRIQDHYHVDLPLRTLFETPTIVDLAEKIESAVVAQGPSMNRIEEKLKAIEQLSEAEVNTLLDEMKKTTAGNGVARG